MQIFLSLSFSIILYLTGQYSFCKRSVCSMIWRSMSNFIPTKGLLLIVCAVWSTAVHAIAVHYTHLTPVAPEYTSHDCTCDTHKGAVYLRMDNAHKRSIMLCYYAHGKHYYATVKPLLCSHYRPLYAVFCLWRNVCYVNISVCMPIVHDMPLP